MKHRLHSHHLIVSCTQNAFLALFGATAVGNIDCIDYVAAAAAGNAVLVSLWACAPQQWADPLARQFAAGRHAHTPHALHARTSTLAGRRRTFTGTFSQRFTDAVAGERGQRNKRQREHGPQRNSSGGPVAVWDPERQRGLQREQQRGAAHPDPHPAIWPPDIFPFGGGKRGATSLRGHSTYHCPTHSPPHAW